MFLGVGLGEDAPLEVPGARGPGVVGATAWIEEMKLSSKASVDGIQRAVVIGGGNTAIDAARELAHLGVREVVMAYRRTQAEMPGYGHELEAARREGVRLVERAVPSEVRRDAAGKLQALKLADGRELPADLIVTAIGQARLRELLASFPGLEVDERGRIVADPKTGKTKNAKTYAGGDAVSGGQEVVNATQEGKRAARAICQALGVPVRPNAPLNAGHR